jgi:hypothetical protein
LFLFFFLWAAAARGEDVEVYDWQTGEYHDFDVKRRGRNIDVYDWSEGRYRDYSISPGCREVYDWQTGNYLDVKPRDDDRFEVCDWREHKYYDVNIKNR